MTMSGGVLPENPGARMPEMIDATVENSYPDRWMVDVSAANGRRWFPKVVVLNPYLHHEGGAGMSFTPPPGTRGVLLLLSDGSPPAFLPGLPNMRPSSGEPGVPQGGKEGTKTPLQEASMAKQPPNEPRFDNNRPPQADGDQCWRGGEGQGVEILVGGVVRSYAGPLCQTIWDVRGKRTSACRTSVDWWEGGADAQRRRSLQGATTYETTHAFRVKATETHASLRVREGKSLLGEPDGFNATEAAALAGLDLDDGVMEMSISPEGFSSYDGEAVSEQTRNKSVFRMLVTLGGGLLIRALQAVVLKLKSKLRIEVEGDIVLSSKGRIILDGKQGVTLVSDGGLKLQGALTQVGGGDKGVARQGDQILCTIPPGTTVGGALLALPPGLSFFSATITSPGSPDFKVG